jgi:hypothetical protein
MDSPWIRKLFDRIRGARFSIERLAHLSGRNSRWRESAAEETASRRDWRESLLQARITRSSAYARIEMELAWCFSGPRESDCALALHFRMINSTDRLKRIALRGHPCLTPEWMGIEGVLPRGVMTSVVASVYFANHLD